MTVQVNAEKLKHAEQIFFNMYPDGFEADEMKAIAKKHKVEKMRQFVEEHFNEKAFENTDQLFEDYVKLIARSSLVSVFEKAKFRDAAKVMSAVEKDMMVKGMKAFLYGNQAAGFEMQIEVLERYKLAKWPILTVLGLYQFPAVEVLVKPTTVKGILKYFEVTDIQYTSKPTYAFYSQYRELVNAIKALAHPMLMVDNAAFCGFLMMTMTL
ncbi:MAG: hypothetical protein PWP38_3074 [Clostridiales bacterium]|jgi:hypothetical protein|nr:hypothetical protein [Clostridiales bacterium]